MNKQRRRFNTGERVAAFLVADGKCEECGAELEPGWHGHHEIPYSLGGATDVINARALCPLCNWRLGNKMRSKIGPWVDIENPDRKPRDWQKKFYDFFIQSPLSWFLNVACPAAGKTWAALRAAHSKLESEDVEMIIVVAHTKYLCKQWIKKAANHGIELHLLKNGDGQPPAGFHGIVTTYQRVDSQPDIFARLCGRLKVMVILDECHHMGENKTWGKKLKAAFQVDAVSILSLSGTPFRGDNTKIPFVEYDDEGRCICNYRYTYTQSIKDKVCRKVEFPLWNTKVKWHVSRDGEEMLETKEINFDDKVSEADRATRLRLALWDEPFLTSMITAANEVLLDIRKDQSDAGAIVFAMTRYGSDEDDSHARFVAKIIYQVTGFKPRIVTYDNDNAITDIEEFERNDEPWIVCIKMISEGVDIPRLRVGVHATNVVAELFFEQAVARILRQGGTTDDYAYYYIPKDPLLMANAKAMEDAVIAAIKEIEERTTCGPKSPPTSTTTIIRGGTEDTKADDSIWRKKTYEQERIDTIIEVLRELDIRCSAAQYLEAQDIIKTRTAQQPDEQEETPESKPKQRVVPMNDRVEILRSEVSTQVRNLTYARAKKFNRNPDFPGTTNEVNGRLPGSNRTFRVASEPELINLLTWLKQELGKLS